MKGDAKLLLKYMEGADKRFIIPIYQRNYDWRTEQCKQLYDDLIKVVKNDWLSHFFGSLVSVNNPDGSHYELLIIDGQQRLTTISLLMLTMYNMIENEEIKPESSNLSARLYEDYLVDKWQPDNRKIKLKPIKSDSNAYEKLFGDKDEILLNSNLTTNYIYFQNRILKEEISIDELYTAIGRLQIIDIALNADDNPQLIFESLNSTGLDLTEGDKIRNYILMGLSIKEQEKYYTSYWNPIEIKTDYDVSSFIRDYLSVKLMETPAISKVYVKFKTYVENNRLDIEELLKSLLVYSKRYSILLHGFKGNNKISSSILRLNKLQTTVIRPFLLEILRMQSERYLTEKDVEIIFEIVESFIFRRIICDLPSASLNKIFIQLHKEVYRLDNNTENYVEKIKYILGNKKEKARFPKDKEFIEYLERKNIYSMQSKNKCYLFERFENGDSKESKNIYQMLDEGEYSIEHIMPQHLTSIWRNNLGIQFEQIHENWLHKLANLTLTAYNSKYSNRPFKEKRDMKNGFKDSGFVMNQKVSNEENWSLEQLIKRNEELKIKAIKLWKNEESKFIPKEKQLVSYSLDDGLDFSGKTIVKFQFQGIDYPAKNWSDMYLKVITALHQEDKSILNNILHDNNDEYDLAKQFSKDSDTFSRSYEIDNNMYIFTVTSINYKINLLRKFFVLFKINQTELIFWLKDGREMLENIDRSDLKKTRLEFWKRTLPLLQEKTGFFINDKPSIWNTLSASIGISGIVYQAVANVDSARAELYIGTENKENNKKIYDALFSNKTEIESNFGGVIEWGRMNDNIASRIYVTLNDVNIFDVNDWDTMGLFLTDTIKRLMDVLQENLLSI